MSFGLANVGDRVAVAAAGLPWPEGDPEGLSDAARQVGVAASAVSLTGHTVGWAAAGATSWQGDAAASFRGAVGDAQSEMGRGSGSLERAAGALSKLATEVGDAQDEVVDLAAKVQTADEAADEAQARAALADVAAAGAGTALQLFGADPPRGLVDAKADAQDAADGAHGTAGDARERALEVRRQAERRARELCEDCERQDRAVAGVVEDAAGAAPTGIGVGAMPGARYSAAVARRMSVSDFKELAFLRAGVDPTAWNPREGLDANDETVRAVYAYYERLGLEHPEFQWMKMAALGGPLFYAGFKDIDAAGDVSPLSGDELDFLPNSWGIGSDELRGYEGQFLRIQKAIFSDLAWQHEAFALGGAGAIHRAVDKLPASERPTVLDRDTAGAWDDIDSGDSARIAAGNFKLIEREQGPVIQRFYDEMLARPSGETFTGELTGRAETPIPGSDSYRDFSEEGNIANYPDRIRWIEGSLWPAHQRLLGEPGEVEDVLRRDFEAEVESYRQFDPEDYAPRLVPPIQPPRIPGIPGLG